MTDVQINNIHIGEPLPSICTIASPTRSREHAVEGLPDFIRIGVYSSDEGWYFSMRGTQQSRPSMNLSFAIIASNLKFTLRYVRNDGGGRRVLEFL